MCHITYYADISIGFPYGLISVCIVHQAPTDVSLIDTKRDNGTPYILWLLGFLPVFCHTPTPQATSMVYLIQPDDNRPEYSGEEKKEP